MEKIHGDGGNTCLAHGGSLYETASDETNLRDQVSHNSFCNCFSWRHFPLLFRMERELSFAGNSVRGWVLLGDGLDELYERFH